MDINQLLGGVFCACGEHHTCDIESVYIEHGAMRRLTDLCAPYERILLVADENTYAAAGEKTEAALKGKIAARVIFGKEILIPDENATERVLKSLGDAALIVGIGSGVIQDLSKYASKLSSVPYMVVATAPSMDGYASTGAAMILGGMKETVSAGLPRAIVADTEVLKNAPMPMLFILDGSTTFSRSYCSLNAYGAIPFTPSGIVSTYGACPAYPITQSPTMTSPPDASAKPVHPSNAPTPMLVTPSGIVTLVSAAHPAKAYSGTSVAAPVNITD